MEPGELRTRALVGGAKPARLSSMPVARHEIVLGERGRQRLVSKLDARHLDDESLELGRRHAWARLLHQRAHFDARGRESLARSRIRSTLDHGGYAGCKRHSIERLRGLRLTGSSPPRFGSRRTSNA